MKEWIVKLIVQWLLANLTEDNLKEWADKAKAWLKPLVQQYKADIMAFLKAEAAKTDTPIDDKIVNGADKFMDYILN